MKRQSFNTAHSKSSFRSVRIIRPNHPLFGQSFPIVQIWKNKKKRFYLIELPDKSHTRIPLDWADEGKCPISKISSNQPVLSASSLRELIDLLTIFGNKVSKTATIRQPFPHRLSKEDEYGKAVGLLPDGGKR